ncbi:MAG TPA: glutamine synthetase family protein [Terriglobales bacterium]|nr:glutamine synthetase family protein [Terriglobales bacterium]
MNDSHSGQGTARPEIADLRECDDFLAQNPDIRFVQIFWTNQSGVPRGKNLLRRDLRPIYEYGRFLPGTMGGLDITGEDVEESGLVWSDGDADRLGRPVPGTLTRAPWLGPDYAQVMLTMYELDGTRCNFDPRHVLQGVVDRFKEFKLTPVIACEMEFFLVDRESAPQGGKQPPIGPVTNHRQHDIQVYGLRELDDFSPFFRDIYAAGDQVGLPLESSISEYAQGQMELGLRHRPDAVRACDDAILYKRLVKGVAVQHGFEATFMAKPHNDIAGSGMHLHVSLADEKGTNAFGSDDPEGSELLRFAVGGMMAMLEDSMAVFAPNANSYRRFRANSYAPVAPTWGVNNRTVSFRVPAGPAHTRHVEHRVCGADANPYLAVAALLSGIHYGLTHRLKPGPAVVGNGYAHAQESGSKLPTNWFAALDLFEKSERMKDYFGPRFHHVFTAVKRAEQDRFFSRVTELDYAWYLRNA